MKRFYVITTRHVILLAGFLASNLFVEANTEQTEDSTQQQTVQTTEQKAPAKTISPAMAARNWNAREGDYYRRTWGVEVVGVRLVSSGYMLEFRYRVLNPDKAKALVDKQQKPLLYDEASNATLSVPTLDKVGEVRQSVKQEVNRVYYMVFGNPGQIVKRGNKVSVTVGSFRADNLVVQ